MEDKEMARICNLLLDYMTEYFNGEQLYDILHNTLKISHSELLDLDFDWMKEYFK